MISVNEALERYERAISPLPVDDVPLGRGLHRVLAEDATSAIDLPPFPQSAMDGYALRTDDTRGACAGHPVRLRLVGTIPAGKLEGVPALDPGEAMVIYTGGHIPGGADVILRQEDATVEGDWLLVGQPLSVGENLRERGEELRAGTQLSARGERVTPGLLGALAMAGVGRLKVQREPRITVLTTGDEVIEPGQSLGMGEVFDANTPLVTSWLRSRGYEEIRAAHLPDDLGGTEHALREALDCSDMVITTGGVSVGERDYVPGAARGAGVEEVFWKVRQKPGKPLYFGLRETTTLLGLPGNPGAVFASLVVHVRRVLDLMEGETTPGPRFLYGRLGFPVVQDSRREVWLRCRAGVSPEGEVWLHRLPHQASHMISNLACATALARIPCGEADLGAGSVVAWTRCGHALAAPQTGQEDA